VTCGEDELIDVIELLSFFVIVGVIVNDAEKVVDAHETTRTTNR